MRYLMLLTYPFLVWFVITMYIYSGAIDRETTRLKNALEQTKDQLKNTEDYVNELEDRIKELERRSGLEFGRQRPRGNAERAREG